MLQVASSARILRQRRGTAGGVVSVTWPAALQTQCSSLRGSVWLESLYRESSDIEDPEKSSHVIAWSHFESIADRIGRISVSVLTFPLYAAFSFVFYIDFMTK